MTMGNQAQTDFSTQCLQLSADHARESRVHCKHPNCIWDKALAANSFLHILR